MSAQCKKADIILGTAMASNLGFKLVQKMLWYLASEYDHRGGVARE
jgi:hypothetical protein